MVELPNPQKPLRRATDGAMLGGVCAGVARWLEWDVTLVRVLVVLIAALTAVLPTVIVYVVFWAIIPPEDSVD